MKRKQKVVKANPFKKGKGMCRIQEKDTAVPQEEDAGKYRAFGEAWMDKREFLKAIALLEKSIALDPTHVDTFLNAGRCYEKLLRYEQAIDHYERALELEPSRVEIRYSLAVSLQLLGLLREAKQEYLKVLRSDCNHVMARNNLSAVYLKEGKREKALEELKKLTEMQPHNPIVRRNLEVAYGKKGSGKKKRRVRKKGISLCVLMREEPEGANNCLKTVLPWVDEVIVVNTLEPCNRARLIEDCKGKVFDHPWEGDFSAARNKALEHATCEWVLVLDPDECVSEEGLSYLRSLLNDQKFEGYRFIQRNYCNDPSLSGWVPCMDGTKQAWNCCGWIPSYPIKMFRNHEDIFFEGIVRECVDGSLYRKGGKVGKANILIHTFAYFLTAEKKIAREKDLLELGEKQLGLTPHDPGLHYDLALRYARLGDFEEAISRFQELMHLTKNNCNIYNDLGNVYFGKQDYETAKKFYQQSVDLAPHFFQAHYNLAGLRLLEGDLDGSWSAYQQALRIYPGCAQVLNNLGVICEKRGMDEKAMRYCKQAIEMNPFLAEAYNNLGVLHGKRGDGFNAEKNFLKALSFDKDYTEASVNLANLRLGEGNRNNGRKILADRIKGGPSLQKSANAGGCG